MFAVGCGIALQVSWAVQTIPTILYNIAKAVLPEGEVQTEEVENTFPSKETNNVSPAKEDPKNLSPVKEDPKNVSPVKEDPKNKSPVKEDPKNVSPIKKDAKIVTPEKQDKFIKEETPKKKVRAPIDPTLVENDNWNEEKEDCLNQLKDALEGFELSDKMKAIYDDWF